MHRTAAVLAAMTFMSTLVVTGTVSTGPDAAHGAQVSTVHGSTRAGAYWWQQGAADCLPMASRVVIGALTGQVIEPDAIDATAAVVAGYGPDGTDWAAGPALLAAYGVTAVQVDGATLDTIRVGLDSTGPVIVDVDAAPIWSYVQRSTYGDVMEHALVVEQIDDAAHTVTLVDTGIGSGRREVVPTSVFLTGWDTAGDSVLVTR